jgi:DcuC family C4-dicarboxylate transporter
LVAQEVLSQPPPGLTSQDCVEKVLPLNLVGLLAATAVFWILTLRYERRNQGGYSTPEESPGVDSKPFQINLFRAAVPLLPLVLLYIVAPPLELVSVERNWLEDLPPDRAPAGRFESRLIGAAMLIGCVTAGLLVLHKFPGVPLAFCEGAGFGFAHIISLIVAARCFGEGIQAIGVHKLLEVFILDQPILILPFAGILATGFGVLCGSGMATAQSIFPFFAEVTLRLGLEPAHVGAVVSLGAAAGRTMSPVAAVALMCSTMTQTNVFQLTRRVVFPLLAAMFAIILVAMAKT